MQAINTNLFLRKYKVKRTCCSTMCSTRKCRNSRCKTPSKFLVISYIFKLVYYSPLRKIYFLLINSVKVFLDCSKQLGESNVYLKLGNQCYPLLCLSWTICFLSFKFESNESELSGQCIDLI